MCVCVCIYTYIYTHIYTPINIQTHMQIHMHIAMHTCVYMHTYTCQIGIQHVLLIIWGFSLLVLQNSVNIFKFKGHFYSKHTML